MTDFKGRSYIDNIPTSNKIRRLIWFTFWFFLFKPTPRWAFNGWRIFLLRAFGAKIRRGCRVLPSCFIWAPWNLELGEYTALSDGVECYSMDKIIIGNRVTISQRAFLCTGSHDISSLRLPLITKPISIGDFVWVCAEAFVGPGCHIGEGAVVAARAVVTKPVDNWMVVGGNPAMNIKIRKIAN